MTLSKITITSLSILAATAIYAQEHDHSTMDHSHHQQGHDHTRPDSHGPISIMGDHSHAKGEWMLSYRYMTMDMDGLRQGTNDISSTGAFSSNYAVAPVSMQMDMHMIGAMKALSDKNTLMLMLPYSDIEMEHTINPAAMMLVAANGGSQRFTTQTSGIGDLKAGLIHTFWQDDNKALLLGAILSLPTGSIDETDEIPVMAMAMMPGGLYERQLPAPMQLGSGSYEFRPSITYTSSQENWSWGSQTKAIFRLDDNENDYRLGDSFTTQAWLSKPLGKSIALNGRLAYSYTGKLDGNQKDLMLMSPVGRTVPTAYAENYGGQSITAAIGANYIFQEGSLKGNRIGIELAAPLYQDLNGTQLATDWTFTIGWQLAGK